MRGAPAWTASPAPLQISPGLQECARARGGGWWSGLTQGRCMREGGEARREGPRRHDCPPPKLPRPSPVHLAPTVLSPPPPYLVHTSSVTTTLA